MAAATDRMDGDNVQSEPSVMELFEWIWRKKIPMVIGLAIGALILWGLTWLQAPVYRAEVIILPAENRGNSNLLSQFAGMAGLSVDLAASPEATYPAILQSHALLGELLDLEADSTDMALAPRLAECLDVDLHEKYARERLKDLLRNEVVSLIQDDMTGVIELRAEMPHSPELAARCANEAADLLAKQLGRENRRRASRRADFVGARLEDVAGELADARSAVTEFVAANRSYGESPALTQRYEELTGETMALQRVWSGLREQLEMEQLEAQGDVATLNILDRARPPRDPVRPNRISALILGALLGLAVSAAVLGFVEARRS